MVTKEQKKSIVEEFGKAEKDTGSSEVQIALLTERIKEISKHLKSFPKDNHSRRGLIKLVGRRRKFLNYLRKKDFNRYEFVKSKLDAKK